MVEAMEAREPGCLREMGISRETAKGVPLQKWVGFLAKARAPRGASATEQLLGCLNATDMKKDDAEFFHSRRSYSIGLAIYASNEAFWREKLTSARSLQEICEALPPNIIQIDALGSAHGNASSMQIQMAEIKNTADSKQWRAAMHQLQRNLLLANFVLKFASGYLKESLPVHSSAENATTSLVGYVAVPGHVDREALESCIADWEQKANQVEAPEVQIIPLIL